MSAYSGYSHADSLGVPLAICQCPSPLVPFPAPSYNPLGLSKHRDHKQFKDLGLCQMWQYNPRQYVRDPGTHFISSESIEKISG